MGINDSVLLDTITYRPIGHVPVGWRWSNGTHYARGFDLHKASVSDSIGKRPGVFDAPEKAGKYRLVQIIAGPGRVNAASR